MDALAQNEHANARTSLRQIIAGRKSGVRLRAIEALADNLRGSEDVAFLVDEFPRMNDLARKQAVMSLGQRQDQTVRVWLLRVASDSALPMSTRVQSLRALSEDDEGLAALLSYYDSPRATPVRAQLLRVLASEGGTRGQKKLRELARNDPDPTLRALAARLLRHETDEDTK